MSLVEGAPFFRAQLPEPAWHDLQVPASELRTTETLATGQCFNWKPVQFADAAAGETAWVGVLNRRVIAVRDTPTTTQFAQLNGDRADDAGAQASLAEYFQLAHPLADVRAQWCARDERLATVAPVLPGLRVLRQDPLECLFSFICSSNNNIARIHLIMSSLRETFGEHLLTLDAKASEEDATTATGKSPRGGTATAAALAKTQHFHAFPTLAVLAATSEADLRALGLGYRARFICETAAALQDRGGEAWLHELRQQSRDVVQRELMSFTGVGAKVADCVALFSLDQTEAIPVDTHVFQIAARDYDPTLLTHKSLTPTVYAKVGDLFRDRFPTCAGWAHSLLFAAELPAFRTRLPRHVQDEMEAFAANEKERKKEKAQAKRERQAAAAEASDEPTTPAGSRTAKSGAPLPATGKRSGASKAQTAGNRRSRAAALDFGDHDRPAAAGGDADARSSSKKRRHQVSPSGTISADLSQ